MDDIGRRDFLGMGAAALAAAASGVGYFERFGIDEGIVRDALAAALSRGGDYADVFFQHRMTNFVALEDGEVNRAYSNVALGVGVRTLRGDSTGCAFTEQFSRESIVAAARAAAAIAEGPARPGPDSLRRSERVGGRYPVRTRWEDVPASARLPLVSGLNERAFAADPRIRKVNVVLSDESSVILVADSTGRLVEDRQPMTSLHLTCNAEKDGRRESNSGSLSARAGIEHYTPERTDKLLSDVVRRTQVLFEAAPPPPGEMPVVLAAGSSGILLHEAIGHGMEADFNRKGISIFADRIGKPVAKPFVSIVDDGTLDHTRGAINVDDEGSDGRSTTLVENGVLASYMHDLVSARHYGVEPTGNGRRESYAKPPIPRMRATYMLPGPHRRDEIIASVKRGLYCETFLNGQVQIGAGDFTFYVKNGWLIEDGRLTRPVKDANVIGNGPKVLEAIDMVADDMRVDTGQWTCGKDGQSAPVSLGIPTVRIPSITVGGRS